MSGFLLPPHLIYTGKTNKCHPNVTFPPGDGMFITQRVIGAQKLLCYTLLTVFLSPMYRPLGNHWAWIRIILLLHSLMSLHHTGVKVFFKLWKKNNIKCCFIPASCTGELQPLDLTVNQVFKQELQSMFYQVVCWTG